MAISPKFFPPRKRQPSPGSFISPNLSDSKLVQSLLLLSQEISALKPLDFLLRRSSSSIIRKSKLLVILFEEILRTEISFLPRSAVLCFEEIYIVLQRIKTLLEDCSNGSKMWLLLQNELVSNTFHELTVELSTLLDIFPVREFDLSDDVKELVLLIRKQCWERKSFIDPTDKNLRYEVLKLLDQIKKEIVPDHSKLNEIFDKLGLRDSNSCKEEIESLEEEVQNQVCEKSTVEMIALIGLVRYAKCVLFGASTPRSDSATKFQSSEIVFPDDFRCPISLDLMRDPVVVATGQTYDRNSISHWIDSGHETCPKTGQQLVHSNLIPNRAMKNLIALWCRENKIPFESTETNDKINRFTVQKAAIEATRMTAFFLVNKLSVSQLPETANRVIYELRVLAKTNSDNRACIAEAGAIPKLVRYLGSDNPQLQVNAVTTILNLSIFEDNKKRIMECNDALDGVIEVLRSGTTWEAKENAAATIFSLSALPEYRKKLWRKTRVVKGLVELAKAGPISAKKDALVAILNLAGDREAVGRLIEGGVVEMAVEVVGVLPEEAAALLATVAKRGGAVAVAGANGAVRKLAEVLRDGPEGAKESAAAGLVSVCRRGGMEVIAELVATPGIERTIWELMGMGTVRARRKGASLLRILRRWAVGMEDQTVRFSTNGSTLSTVDT
ncbi:Armadillo [Macleaya cordata]|uniref:RING-type E3 ubiquitin transferase n=1 Tax=Macleaya cordata TaxID=56857 RepID=A0A200R3G1_MACCD|nr:Armadillo [Macleaya cordata]